MIQIKLFITLFFILLIALKGLDDIKLERYFLKEVQGNFSKNQVRLLFTIF